MVLAALNITSDRDKHTHTSLQEASVRPKIRTYETLALTACSECMHYRRSHAFGPDSVRFGWRKCAN